MRDRLEGEAAGARTEAADPYDHDRHCEGDEGEDGVDPAEVQQKGDDEADSAADSRLQE